MLTGTDVHEMKIAMRALVGAVVTAFEMEPEWAAYLQQEISGLRGYGLRLRRPWLRYLMTCDLGAMMSY